jgi:rSAM/selenodomain-associated transferase 1
MDIDPLSNSSRIKRKCALGLMAKVPFAGAVKTRLTPPLTPEEAAKLSMCFLRDMTSNLAGLREDGMEGVVLYTPAGAEKMLHELLPNSFGLVPQRGETLGERLINAASELLNKEFDSVCLINSDSPTLPSKILKTATTLLAQNGDRVVLGPSQDGGYYLIGLNRPHRNLFQRIAWSTRDVLAHTIDRAAEIHLAVDLLPEWYDVDDEATLRVLYEELGLSTDGRGPHARYDGGYSAPFTRKYLAELLETGRP